MCLKKEKWIGVELILLMKDAHFRGEGFLQE
jgi:hypothetical protein